MSATAGAVFPMTRLPERAATRAATGRNARTVFLVVDDPY
jgi:hypothetical protein